MIETYINAMAEITEHSNKFGLPDYLVITLPFLGLFLVAGASSLYLKHIVKKREKQNKLERTLETQ